MTAPFVATIEKRLGSKPVQSRFLDGGDIADVSKLTLKDGREIVAKRPRMDQPDTTACEAMMLGYLAKNSALPVPEVLHQEAGLLVISYITNRRIEDAATVAESAALHVAALHSVFNPDDQTPFGFGEDTFIGPLPQQNRFMDNWVDFFRERRLLAMRDQIANTGRVTPELLSRIEAFASRLENFLPKRPAAALLHGDIWRGNILTDGTQVTGFIDPAISYGHNEMDLAFIALMGGLDNRFFEAYGRLDPGFLKERCSIYQLWPLLVHVKLFGGGYVDQVAAILTKFE